MRALTVVPGESNSIRLDEFPAPPASDGAVLVRALALGICARKFPTGLLHLALVNTANNLAHYQEPAEQRAEHRVVEKPPMQPD
jgi:hypothetical protein